MTSCEEKMFTEVVFKIIYEMFYEDDVMKLDDAEFCRSNPDKVMAIIDEIYCKKKMIPQNWIYVIVIFIEIITKRRLKYGVYLTVTTAY